MVKPNTDIIGPSPVFVFTNKDRGPALSQLQVFLIFNLHGGTALVLRRHRSGLFALVLFTPQQFNWGPLLNFSMVVKYSNVDKISQENLDSRKIVVLSHEVHFVQFYNRAAII